MAKENRLINKSLKVPSKTLDELDWLCNDENPNKKYNNFSDAINKLSAIGLLLMRSESKIQSGEMMKELNGFMRKEQIMDWLQSLSPTQRTGINEMIHLIEEGKQTHL